MTDLATLSLAIDSRPAVTAAGDLDKLVTAAAGAEKATSSLGASATQTVGNVQKIAATTSQAVGGINAMSQAANNNAKAIGLSANELRNLGFQINDVATMALSGASAFQIMATQGGQLLQIAQSSGGGVRGLMEQAGNAASSAAARIGLVGGALGALAAGLATATAAAMIYNAQQKELERSTFTVGRASGATLQTLNDAALAGSAGGTISASAARDVVGQLNSTGKIDPRVYADVAANARDLAKLLGTDIPGATETVTGALAGGISGFDRLNASLGLGGAALREQVKDLYESGRAFEAQRVIVDAYAKRVQEFAGQKGFFERLSEKFDFGRNTSNELDMIGRALSGASTPEQQLAAARKRQAGIEYQRDAGLGYSPNELAAAAAEVAKLESSIKGAADKSKDAKTALQSLTVQPLIDSLNPAQKRIDDLQHQAQLIGKYLAEGGIDKDGAAKRTMDGLNAQARQLADDLGRGGMALADGLRRAQFEASQVGRAGVGRNTADINFEFEQRQRRIEAENQEPNARNAALQALELERVTRLQTTQREATLSETQRSGLLNRVPENLRQHYVDAAAQTGVPLDLLLGVSYAESRFNPQAAANKNFPTSHAYGLMQLQPGTARELGVDPTDPRQNVLGGARYLRDRLDQANGDEALAYGLYHDGPGTSGNSAAARTAFAAVQRFRNMPTTGQEIAGTDERSRALENERRLVAINTQYLGQNGEALDAATREQQLLNQAVAQGREITPQLREEFAKTAAGMAAAARSLAGTQAGSALQFDRDQIGRDRYDQQAFSRARSIYGDVTTPQATAYIDQARQTAVLADARTTLSDSMGGFVTALSHGASAADAMSSALSRVGDKLISGALDSLTGSLFKSIGGSGGGDLLGGIGKLFGFANGGIMTGRGALPLHTYATGGVASSPQMAIFGEGRTPEAYVPLPDGRRIPVAMSAPANANAPAAGPTDARSYNIDLRGSTLTRAEVQSALQQAIAQNNTERDRTSQERNEMLRRAAF